MNRLAYGILFVLAFLCFQCQAKAPTGVFEDVKVESAGVERHYRMVVPENYSSDKPIGVLFGYHGGGPYSFLIQLRDLGYEDLADEAYWITISVAAVPNQSWHQDEDPAKNREVILVKDTLKKLRTDYAIDDNRVFAVGVSAGSFLSRYLAKSMPDTFAAIAGILSGLNQWIEPAEESNYAAMYVCGSQDIVLTRWGLETLATQFPEIYKWDEAALDAFEPLGIPHFMEAMIKTWQPLPNDLDLYYLNIGHEFPPDDPTTYPPQTYTQKITRFFCTHPKGYQTRVFNPPSTGKPFRDEFDDSSGLLASPRWTTYSADTEGHYGNMLGAGMKLVNGQLCSEAISSVTDKPDHPIASYCFTDFIAKPLKWETTFTLPIHSESLLVYPCILCDMQGRWIYLKVTSTGWEWSVAENNLAFQSKYTPRIHELQRGVNTFAAETPYRVVVKYNKTAPEWKIIKQDGTIAAKGVLPNTMPYLDAYEIGLGIEGLPDESARFDYVEVSKP